MPGPEATTILIVLAGVVVVVAGILAMKLPPFLALLAGALTVGLLTPDAIRLDSLALQYDAATLDRLGGVEAVAKARGTVPSQVAAAFGTTCGKIGLLIALAAVIGQTMRHSGAADVVVRTILAAIGVDRAPAALVASSFVVGIPVFFDTVFYLMIPIARSVYRQTGGNFLFLVLCIICGGTMAHSLIPPTPGPLYIAENLNISLGVMIAAGLAVGAVTVGTGFLFARWISRGSTLLPPDEAVVPAVGPDAIDADGPPFSLAMLPIVVPVLLLGLSTTLDTLLGKDSLGSARWLLDKNMALVVGAAIGIGLLRRWNQSDRDWSDLVSESLLSGGLIVLITGVGGAFGAMLQLAGVRQLFDSLPDVGTAGLLTLGFVVTAAVRTAQGSSTVAMITAVGLFKGITPEELGCHPVYLAMAIGCGGKPLAWMNDSAFWVMTRLSGMTPAQGLRTITPMTATMAVVGQVFIVAAAAVLPLID